MNMTDLIHHSFDGMTLALACSHFRLYSMRIFIFQLDMFWNNRIIISEFSVFIILICVHDALCISGFSVFCPHCHTFPDTEYELLYFHRHWETSSAVESIGDGWLVMGTGNRYFFGPVHNCVNTGLPVSFRTNDTVIDTYVVLSPYTSMLMTN